MVTLAKNLLFLALLLTALTVEARSIYGLWYLDTSLSDDPTKTLQGKKDKKKRKQAKETQQSSLPDAPAPRPNPLPLLSAKTLHIEAHGEQLEIIPDQGQPLRVVPDGNAAPVSLSDWGKRETNPVQFGTWEGDTLVMERSLDAGPHVIQTYSVDDEGILLQRTELQRPPADTIILKRYFRDIDPQSAVTPVDQAEK